MYCLLSEAQPCPACRQREGKEELRSYTTYISMPAQRQAEVLGTLTHAQLYVTYQQLTLCIIDRHWSGHRQLIAVTCIAEHA